MQDQPADQLNVLVIDDDPDVRNLLVEIIMRKQHQVIAVESAEEGLDLVQGDFLPDLVLMDIQLPGMDGLTATRILREIESMRGVPIIALTSFAMEGDRERCLVAGCSGYLTKPIRVAECRTEVSEVLDQLDPHDQLDRSEA